MSVAEMEKGRHMSQASRSQPIRQVIQPSNWSSPIESQFKITKVGKDLL